MQGAQAKIENWTEEHSFEVVKETEPDPLAFQWIAVVSNFFDTIWHLMFHARVVRKVGPGHLPEEKNEIENLKARFHRFGGGLF